MNTRKIGTEKEEMACRFLTQKGVKIRERNFRCRQGEIDIVGDDGEYLVFFEVKYRKSTSKGSASEAVDYRKQQKICKVSDYYRLLHHCPADTPIRYDVIAIDGEQLEWMKDAFAYCNRKAW